MRRFLGMVAVTLALLFAAEASAQTTWLRYLFVAVDAVSVQPGYVTITGILDGEDEPREVIAYFSSSSAGYGDALQACHRAALLALEKPGAYRLELSGLYAPTSVSVCKLLRVNP